VTRFWVCVWIVFVVSCGGGGGGGPAAFEVIGASPQAGDAEVPVDQALLVVFNRPADVSTVNTSNISVERSDGTRVGIEIFIQGFNASAVNIKPLAPLWQNVLHRIVLSDDIRSEDGAPLRASSLCFVTMSDNPTVRPDQVLDLGDALNVPRYLARQVRLPNGKILVIGGYTNAADATDTLEIYEPATRTFRLLGSRLSVPRAEHAATVLNDGRVLITGGVSTEDGPPLRSTDIFNTGSEGVGPGPDLQVARRYHAESPYEGGLQAMVSGGVGADGNALDSIERFTGNAWVLLDQPLPRPSTRGLQINYDFDKVYFSASNLDGVGGLYDGVNVTARQEGDIRFRSQYMPVGDGHFAIFGGDTRSFATYVFSSNLAWGGSDFLRERRGAHTVTVRGLGGRRFLVAGGFNIAVPGAPALRTLEIYDSQIPGPFGFPDLVGARVDNVLLPVPFAGHVGFNEPDGPTVLAGGFGDGVGPHSRRVAVILDNVSAPTVVCR